MEIVIKIDEKWFAELVAKESKRVRERVKQSESRTCQRCKDILPSTCFYATRTYSGKVKEFNTCKNCLNKQRRRDRSRK